MSEPGAQPASTKRSLLVVGIIALVVVIGAAAILVTRTSGPSAASPPKITTGSSSHIHALIVNPDGSLILADQDGLWHGKRGGGHWTPYGAPVSHLMPISVGRMGNVFLAGTTTLSNKLFGAPHGLYRSTDGGRHWRRASLPDLDVLRLVTNPGVPNVVVAFAGPDSNQGVGHGGIWASMDQGQSWRRINVAVGNDAENGLLLLPGHPFTVLFASTFNIIRTLNGGRTWQTVGRSIPEPLTLASSPNASAILYAGAANGVWVSANAGTSWRHAWAGPPTPVVTSGGTSGVYVYAGGLRPGLFRLPSASGMKACLACMGGLILPSHAIRIGNPVPSAQPIVLTPDLSHPRRLYAGYNFPLRLFVSNDSGVAWRQIL